VRYLQQMPLASRSLAPTRAELFNVPEGDVASDVSRSTLTKSDLTKSDLATSQFLALLCTLALQSRRCRRTARRAVGCRRR